MKCKEYLARDLDNPNLHIPKSAKIRFECKQCNKESVISYRYFNLHPFLCKTCYKQNHDWSERGEKIRAICASRTKKEILESNEKRRKTWIEKYGCHPACREEQKSRTRETCQQLYGGSSPIASDEVKRKLAKTISEKYGEDIVNAFQASVVKQKIKKTCLRKYGVENPHQNLAIQKKASKTNLERYGGIGFASTDLVAKYQKTCLLRYGVENSNSASEVKAHKRQALIAKHGDLKSACQYRSACSKNSYFIDGIFVDSLPELCFYLYHRDLGNDIVRGDHFSYEVGDVIRDYVCDFLVNGQNIEIKGPHLWNGTRLCAPFCLLENQESIAYYEAKTACMLQNNVRLVLTNSKEMRKIMHCIVSRYGKDYLRSLRNDCTRPLE